jgi:hypothetical protein
MPKVYHVKKCRKSPGKCGKCGCEIKVGDPYVNWSFRRSVGKAWVADTRIRCDKPACKPTPKDLTSSEFMRALYEIQEHDFTNNTTQEDMESMRDDVIGELESLRDETREKFDNMPEGLQQGDTGQTLEQRCEALDDVIIELQDIDIEPQVEELKFVEDEDSNGKAWTVHDPESDEILGVAKENEAKNSTWIFEPSEKYKQEFADGLYANEAVNFESMKDSLNEWHVSQSDEIERIGSELNDALNNVNL